MDKTRKTLADCAGRARDGGDKNTGKWGNQDQIGVKPTRKGSSNTVRIDVDMAGSSDGETISEEKAIPAVRSGSPQRTAGKPIRISNEGQLPPHQGAPTTGGSSPGADSSRNDHQRHSPPRWGSSSERDALARIGHSACHSKRITGAGHTSGRLNLEHLLRATCSGKTTSTLHKPLARDGMRSADDAHAGHCSSRRCGVSINDLANASSAEMAELVEQCPAGWLNSPKYVAELLKIVATKGSKPLLDWLERHAVDFRDISENHLAPDEPSLLLLAAKFGHGSTACRLATHGLRCKLAELATSTPKVLNILLRYSADVIKDSDANRKQVLVLLAGCKTAVEKNLQDNNAVIHDSHRSQAKQVKKNALANVVPLIKAGAIVTPEALTDAVVTNQHFLAWAMLNHYMKENPVKQIWKDVESAWNVMGVAISIGDMAAIDKLLTAKREGIWQAEEANVAIELAKHVLLYEEKGAKIPLRAAILQILEDDRTRAREMLEHQQLFHGDYWSPPPRQKREIDWTRQSAQRQR